MPDTEVSDKTVVNIIGFCEGNFFVKEIITTVTQRKVAVILKIACLSGSLPHFTFL